MREKYIPNHYLKRGSFGNNTTIPDEEKSFIARQAQGVDGAILRGEQALNDLYKEYGLKPKGPYTDFE